jgi:hypothetical protein
MHLMQGYAALHSPEGDVIWRSGHLENALLDQGELEVLNVFLREQTHKTKYLALLDMPSLDDPSEASTIASLAAYETKTPASGGYARQQVLAADWDAPVLADDYRSEAAAPKVFGPMTSADALATHILMVTTATGIASPATLALAHLPLGTQITIAIGLTFSFTPSVVAF